MVKCRKFEAKFQSGIQTEISAKKFSRKNRSQVFFKIFNLLQFFEIFLSNMTKSENWNFIETVFKSFFKNKKMESKMMSHSF